jgi:predicted ABC-type ATPase
MNPDPTIIIIAGPNGAGKTTFAREFLPREANCLTFINADLIAQGLSPFRPEEAAVRAARLMLEMIAECVVRGESFAIETTLSGRTYARMIPQWGQAGYQVALFFLQLPNEDLAVARVADRVAQGGHDIPESVIRRRFQAGIANFHNLYKPLVDAWKLYDNSGERPILINSSNLP